MQKSLLFVILYIIELNAVLQTLKLKKRVVLFCDSVSICND